MNSVRSNNVSLKYQRFATLGFKDKGIINSEFVATFQPGKTTISFIILIDIGFQGNIKNRTLPSLH